MAVIVSLIHAGLLIGAAVRPDAEQSDNLSIAVHHHGGGMTNDRAHSNRSSNGSTAEHVSRENSQSDQPIEEARSNQTGERTQSTEKTTPEKESFRTNLCKEAAEVLDGEKKMPLALQGKTIHAVVCNLPWKAEIAKFNEKDGSFYGYGMDVLKEVMSKERGDFTVQVHLGDLDVSKIEGTMEQADAQRKWLEENANRYDIILNLVASSLENEKLNLHCPYMLTDQSTVFVAKAREEKELVECFLSVLEPLTPGVWITFLCCSAITGFLYYTMEGLSDGELKNAPDADQPSVGIPRALYRTFMSAIQVAELKPGTLSGRILTASSTLVGLVVIMSYSASLVSFFVADSADSIPTSLSAAIRQGDSICESPRTFYLEHQFPEFRNFKKFAQPIDHMVQDKKSCVGTLISKNGFNMAMVSKEANPNCGLKIAEVLETGRGGFAIYDDNGGLCTSLVRDVFEYHLMSMSNEGKLDELYQRGFLGPMTTRDEKCTQTADTGPHSPSLDLKALSGVFMFHALMSIVAILCKCFLGQRPPKSNPSKPEEKNVAGAATGASSNAAS